jgi:hypothetical protein
MKVERLSVNVEKHSPSAAPGRIEFVTEVLGQQSLFLPDPQQHESHGQGCNGNDQPTARVM